MRQKNCLVIKYTYIAPNVIINVVYILVTCETILLFYQGFSYLALQINDNEQSHADSGINKEGMEEVTHCLF